MNIEIAKIKLAPNLTKDEEAVVLATKEKKISEISRRTIDAFVSTVINSCLLVLGNVKGFEDMDRLLMEKEIASDLIGSFGGLTLGEIRIACQRGARGEYKNKPDEVLHVSVRQIYEWIKVYIEKSKRVAMQKQARFEQDGFRKHDVTEDDKRKLEEDFIRDCILIPYHHYVTTGEFKFDFRGNIVYDTLDKLHAIPFTVQKKKVIFERAKHLVIAQLEQYPNQESRTRLQQIKDGDGEGHRMVKSKAKELALIDFINEMKETQMDLGDWIEMRRYHHADH